MSPSEATTRYGTPLHRRADAPALLTLAALIAASWLVYGRALDAPFIYDDNDSIVDNSSIRQLWPLFGSVKERGPLYPEKYLPTAGRPLVNYTLALNYHLGQLKPHGYRAVNIMIHALSAWLVFLIVRRTLRLPYFSESFQNAAPFLAFAVALLWALHPLQTEAVVYVTQRTELLVALFYLATLYCSLRYWSTNEDLSRKIWLIAATLACLAGMASKEVMVTAPVVIMLYEWTFFARSPRDMWRKSWSLYACFTLGWLLLVMLAASGPRTASAGFHHGVSAYAWWLTQSKFLLMYLRLAVWPWPLSIHYEMPYLQSFAAAWTYVLPVALLAIGTLVLVWWRSSVGFVTAWMLLILSPTLLVPIVTEMAAERRMYLPLAGLVALVVIGGFWLLQHIVASRIATFSILAVTILLAIGAAVVSANRLRLYNDEMTIWQDVLARNPQDSTAHYNVGVFLANRGRQSEAITNYEQALQADPNYAKAHYNLGVLFDAEGRHEEAVAHYKRAIELRPTYSSALNNLGSALAKSGDSKQALEFYERAARFDPDNAEAQLNLGVALLKAGRGAEAASHLEQAVKMQPANALAHSSLANALLVTGQAATARDEATLAVRLQPDMAPAHNNLGAALAQLGQFTEATQHFENAVKLQPDFAQAHANLMAAYAALQRPADAIATAEKAASLARAAGDNALADQIEAWLTQYRNAQSTQPKPD